MTEMLTTICQWPRPARRRMQLLNMKFSKLNPARTALAAILIAEPVEFASCSEIHLEHLSVSQTPPAAEADLIILAGTIESISSVLYWAVDVFLGKHVRDVTGIRDLCNCLTHFHSSPRDFTEDAGANHAL